MKTIKKCFKQILCVAVFALLAVLFAFNPTIAMFSNTGVGAVTVSSFEQAILNALKLPIEDVDLNGDNTELRIPLLSKTENESTVEVPSEYYIRVTAPDGTFHDCKITSAMESTDDTYFEFHKATENVDPLVKNGYITVKNLTNGWYYVSYYFKTTETKDKNIDRYYFSAPVEVYVKNVSFELTFVTPDGVKQLTKSTVKKGDVIDLPIAYVKYADRDEYYKLEDKEEEIKPQATWITCNGTPLTAESPEFKEVDGKFTLTPAQTGTYSIKYTAHGESVTKTFDVLETYDSVTKLTIPVKDLTMPSVQLGQKGVKLPALTVNNDVSNNIDHNVEKIEIVKDSNKSIKQTLKPNTFTFDMTIESFKKVSGSTETPITNYYDLIGDYSVTYYVKDAYGNTTQITLALTDVQDSSAPSVYMAYNYELNNGEWATDSEGLPYAKATDANSPVTVKTKTEDDEVVDDVNTDYAVDLKANYGFEELYFPAIYAKDLVTNYQDYIFIRYLQSVSNSSTRLYLDNLRYSNKKVYKVESGEAGYNYATGDNTGIGKFNQVVTFKFNETDRDSYLDKEYTLRYQVIAKSLLENGEPQQSFVLQEDGDYYTFKILNRSNVGSSTTEEFSTPTIKINVNGNNKTIGQNEELSFSVTSTDKNDKRLKNIVFYYNKIEENETAITKKIQDEINTIAFGSTTAGESGYASSYFEKYTSNVLDREAFITKMKSDFTGFTLFDADTNEQFSTKLKLSSTNEITVVAVTINDNNVVSVATKNYKIKNTAEGVAPTVTSIDKVTVTGEEGANILDPSNGPTVEKEQKFGQSQVVYLPKVVFADETDNSLTLSVRYYILPEDFDGTAKVEYLKVDNLIFSRTTIDGATLTTSAVGRYYVVYTAEDDAGNQSFLYFTFVVEDTSKPILYVDVYAENDNNSFSYTYPNITADIDTTITIVPTIWSSNLSTDLTKDDMSNISIVVEGKPSPDFIGNSETEYSYKFTEPGDYIATITGWKETKDKPEENAQPKVIYIHIDVPTLTWNNLEKAKNSVDPYANPGENVYLPELTASQGRVNVEYTVSVKGRSHGEQEILTEENTGRKYFVVPQDTKNPDNDIDVYTIKYSASTKYSSLKEEVIATVKVGDSIKPTMAYATDTESKLQKELVYDGKNALTYAIELNKADNELNIVVSSNGKKISEISTGLQINDKNNNPNKSYTAVTDWDNLNVSLVAVDGQTLDAPTTEGNTTTYTIKEVGKYKLVLTFTDTADNEGRSEFVFNVVSKTQPKKVNDNVVGVVLIVVSLVILAGVILFFTFTGKKGGSGKTKTNKTSKKAAEQVAETVESTDTDAKSGDVE